MITAVGATHVPAGSQGTRVRRAALGVPTEHDHEHRHREHHERPHVEAGSRAAPRGSSRRSSSGGVLRARRSLLFLRRHSVSEPLR